MLCSRAQQPLRRTVARATSDVLPSQIHTIRSISSAPAGTRTSTAAFTLSLRGVASGVHTSPSRSRCIGYRIEIQSASAGTRTSIAPFTLSLRGIAGRLHKLFIHCISI